MALIKEKTQINKLNPNDYRYERKFNLDLMDLKKAENHIRQNSKMFKEIFHKRIVNNIYMDTHDLSYYHQNLIGNSFRRKVRIRWYGECDNLISSPTLEIKIKNGLLGKKLIFPLNPLSFDFKRSNEKIIQIISESNIPLIVKNDLKNLVPTINNTYERKYFLSSDKKYRITLDSNQKFYRMRPINNFLNFSYFDKKNVILELKYNKRYERNAQSITNQFPFRLTKNSKYVFGIKKLFN